MSPVADGADAALVAEVRSASPFDSVVPALSIVDTPAGEFHGRFGGTIAERLSRFESDDIDFEWNATDRAGATGAARQ
jgi:hypothetical protein